MGVLASDQVAIDDSVRIPVCSLRENSALLLELRLDQEGHRLSELDRGLLSVSESRDLLSCDEGLQRVEERSGELELGGVGNGQMTNGIHLSARFALGESDDAVAVAGRGFACSIHRFDAGLEGSVVDEVLAAAVPTREVDGVTAVGEREGGQRNAVAKLSNRDGVVEELLGVLGEEVAGDRTLIDGDGTAGRASDDALEAGLEEGVVWSRELLKPQTSGVPVFERRR